MAPSAPTAPVLGIGSTGLNSAWFWRHSWSNPPSGSQAVWAVLPMSTNEWRLVIDCLSEARDVHLQSASVTSLAPLVADTVTALRFSCLAYQTSVQCSPVPPTSRYPNPIRPLTSLAVPPSDYGVQFWQDMWHPPGVT